MNIYDVIDKVTDMDNLDKIRKILDQRCFSTSFITQEVKEEMAVACKELYEMGEKNLYNFFKSAYGLTI